jgi:hypothetical protein
LLYDLLQRNSPSVETLGCRRFALGSIFINYRRNDSEGEAGRLFDELEKHFGEHAVFMDVAGIEPGQDFRKAINKSVAACSVLLAVIGQQWLDMRDAAGSRRLDDPADFVRIELTAALQANTPIVPVLVRGSHMPRADELPDDLKELAYRNAVELTHARWKSDIQVLVRALRSSMSAIVAEGYSEAPLSEPPAASAATPRNHPAPRAPEIDAGAVERLSRELAVYLGPIANMVVKRAAQRATTFEELCAAVAREILSESDRARFLRSCRR